MVERPYEPFGGEVPLPARPGEDDRKKKPRRRKKSRFTGEQAASAQDGSVTRPSISLNDTTSGP